MSPEKKRWVEENLNWVIPLLVAVVMAVGGWLLATYTEVVKHEVRITMGERLDAERDQKSERMVNDLSEIKIAVVKLATIAENKAGAK